MAKPIRLKAGVKAVKLAAIGASASACLGQGASGEPVDLVIYSPSPPGIMLDAHNRALGTQLSSCEAFGSVEVKPVALPEAIDVIRAVDAVELPYHLPIMTTLDFQTAVDGTAPAWHAYDPPASDLRFVTTLYDVAFGILAFETSIETPGDLRGKRIAVPARPSSVRWFTKRSRFRNRIARACCFLVLGGTNLISGRCAAMTIASASAASFFWRFTNGFTYCGAISFTS